MKELTGDLWDYVNDGYIVITTNGALNSRGECVMGRGTAAQAKNRYRGIAKQLGTLIKVYGNHVTALTTVEGAKLIAFPVKHHWAERADPKLIVQSVRELKSLIDSESRERGAGTAVFMPRPGCGNGGLTWDVVSPMLRDILDNRFTIVERHP